MIVEPGAFRRGFNTPSALLISQPIKAYDPPSLPYATTCATTTAIKPAIPPRRQRQFSAALNSDHPPLRLVLGADAAHTVDQSLREQRAEFDAWQPIARGSGLLSIAADQDCRRDCCHARRRVDRSRRLPLQSDVGRGCRDRSVKIAIAGRREARSLLSSRSRRPKWRSPPSVPGRSAVRGPSDTGSPRRAPGNRHAMTPAPAVAPASICRRTRAARAGSLTSGESHAACGAGARDPGRWLRRTCRGPHEQAKTAITITVK